jgi:hypothetical protein
MEASSPLLQLRIHRLMDQERWRFRDDAATSAGSSYLARDSSTGIVAIPALVAGKPRVIIKKI